MNTKEIDSFGLKYILTDNEIDKFDSLVTFLEEEEIFILDIKSNYGLEVREDLLILFVQLYLLRFAIPYYQICQNRFPDNTDVVFLKKILYACLIGRCIDDLVDNDSEMFKTYESILLFQKYYPRLLILLSNEEKVKFEKYLFDSTKYKSPQLEGSPSFDQIELDVYDRIKYFFFEAENFPAQNQNVLKAYVGNLLGGLDVNDSIADGYIKSSSTVVSNYVYFKYINDEGKLLLNEELLNFYAKMKSLLKNETEKLLEYCEANNLSYTANILKAYLK